MEKLKSFENNLIKGTYIDFFGNDFSTEVHPEKFFIHVYGELCYTYVINSQINVEEFLKKITEKYQLKDKNFLFKYEYASGKKFEKIDQNMSQYLIKIRDRLLIDVQNNQVTCLYAQGDSFLEIDTIKEFVLSASNKKKHTRKFYMIARSPHSEFGFDLQKFNVKQIKVSLEENYNDDFLHINQIIDDFLQKEDVNGLVLLHGKYGTGKTTYLRHLISSINKRFIFLPLNLMEAISSPNFLPFISQYKDSILILEDCEELLVPRENFNANSNSLVNLLNLGDGLLSDALSIKLVCTFNADLKQIDKAILRKGRLIARYEFKPLEINKAQAIADKNKIDIKIKEPMTLADIYNKASEDYSEIGEKKKVGFQF